MFIYNIIFFSLAILLIREFVATNTAKNTGEESKALLNMGWQIALTISLSVMALFGSYAQLFGGAIVLLIGVITWSKKTKQSAKKR